MTRRAPAESSAPAPASPRGSGAPLRLASGGSPLARARASAAVEALAGAPEPVPAAIVTIASGPGPSGAAPAGPDGESGRVVQQARRALLDRRVDASVHSLAGERPEPLSAVVLGAVLPRGDPRDALVASRGRRLADLPSGARVAADSPRGASLLRTLRPDLMTAHETGGVDAALRLVAEGRYDAVLTALAGLARLGREREATQIFDAGEFVPAPGQGAIAIECRAGDDRTLALLAAVDHGPTRTAVAAERGVLEALGEGDALRVGAYATVEGELVSLRAMLPDAGGALPLVGDAAGPAAEAARVGHDLGRQLREAAMRDSAGVR